MHFNKIVMLGLAGVAVVVFSTGGFAGQMSHQGGQMTGQGGMQHGAMMMSTDQTMQNIDKIMSNATAMMRDLAKMHAGMAGHEQHDPMMQSMQGLLDQMRQFQQQMRGATKDHMMMQNSQAMTSLNGACQDLERMASAFESMTKDMTQMMKANQKK